MIVTYTQPEIEMIVSQYATAHTIRETGATPEIRTNSHIKIEHDSGDRLPDATFHVSVEILETVVEAVRND